MLTLKQKRFCEYLVGECEGNATESAKRAGYSSQTAGKNTTNMLKSKEVQEYLKQLQDEIKDKYTEKVVEVKTYNIASIAEIPAFWTSIFSDETQRTVDRLKASELLAKAQGMFIQDW